jgi:hypothetical protein
LLARIPSPAYRFDSLYYALLWHAVYKPF